MLLLSSLSCKNKGTETVNPQPVADEVPPSLRDNKKATEIIRLTDKEKTELAIQTAQVSSNFVDYEISAPGVVFPAPDHSSIISSPINGQVIKINIHEGGWVNKGQEMFRLQSLEFGNLISEYLQAQAEEDFQTNRLKRLETLVEETISSESELERATSEYQRAVASSKSAYAKLRAVGVPDSEIKLFREAKDFDPTLKIYSPISGVVEKNFVELGQSVNALENLSRVLDTRDVLVRGYVSPNDAQMIMPGNQVVLTKREQQGTSIKTTITSINPGLDEASKSVIVNIMVKADNGWPKPGENLRLIITSETKKESIAIPLEALTYDGNDAIVFVKKTEDSFEKRPIQVDEIRDQYVYVLSGLMAGEEVAVTKVFSLKALSRFDVISEE
jgi:cobalt-zinc-cadmium efflux system membrane fusion protein